MAAAVASKSADTAAGAQRSPSFAQTSRPSRPARRTWPGMIEARLAPTGQSAPGTGRLQSLATAGARYGRITGQRRARHPARVTSGSSAPSAASRPRTTSADRSAGPPPGRSGAKPAAATARCLSAGSPARQRRPPDSLHQAQRSCHICQCQACAPLPIRPGHRIPRSGALLRPSAHPLTAFISADTCAGPGPGSAMFRYRWRPPVQACGKVVPAGRGPRRHVADGAGPGGWLRGREAGRFGVGPAVVPGQDLAEVGGPVRDGAVADLAAGDWRWVMVTGKRQELECPSPV